MILARQKWRSTCKIIMCPRQIPLELQWQLAFPSKAGFPMQTASQRCGVEALLGYRLYRWERGTRPGPTSQKSIDWSCTAVRPGWACESYYSNGWLSVASRWLRPLLLLLICVVVALRRRRFWPSHIWCLLLCQPLSLAPCSCCVVSKWWRLPSRWCSLHSRRLLATVGLAYM